MRGYVSYQIKVQFLAFYTDVCTAHNLFLVLPFGRRRSSGLWLYYYYNAANRVVSTTRYIASSEEEAIP